MITCHQCKGQGKSWKYYLCEIDGKKGMDFCSPFCLAQWSESQKLRKYRIHVKFITEAATSHDAWDRVNDYLGSSVPEHLNYVITGAQEI